MSLNFASSCEIVFTHCDFSLFSHYLSQNVDPIDEHTKVNVGYETQPQPHMVKFQSMDVFELCL